MWVQAHTPHPTGGLLTVSRCVSTDGMQAEADRPGASLGWPCFLESTLRSWESLIPKC